MTTVATPLTERLAKSARFVLLAAIAVVVSLLIIGAPNRGSINPFSVNGLHAESLASAPGFLVMTVPVGAGHFHVIDTDKKVICVYSMVGDKIHLVSARKFDTDSDVLSSDVSTPKHPAGIGGGNGVTRLEAKDYADEIQKILEKAANKPGKK